jgi:hypothetical protein
MNVSMCTGGRGREGEREGGRGGALGLMKNQNLC